MADNMMAGILIVKGLAKFTNTSYMNSCLQVLYAIHEFREYILESDCPQPMHASLKTLFQTMSTETEHTSINPGLFWKAFTEVRPLFRRRVQHDAFQCLFEVIGCVHEEFKTSNPNDDHIIPGLFSFRIRSYCPHKSAHNTYNYWSFSVVIPETEGNCSVIDSLNRMLEFTGAVNKKCLSCEWLPMSLETEFYMPPVLIVNLHRFVANGTKFVKNVMISSNETIKGYSYTLIACIRHKEQEFNVAVDRKQDSSFSGHYDAFCKYDDNWVHFDDDVVKTVADVKWDNMPGAYILFYRKEGVNILGEHLVNTFSGNSSLVFSENNSYI